MIGMSSVHKNKITDFNHIDFNQLKVQRIHSFKLFSNIIPCLPSLMHFACGTSKFACSHAKVIKSHANEKSPEISLKLWLHRHCDRDMTFSRLILL